jgi:hypothetical protein
MLKLYVSDDPLPFVEIGWFINEFFLQKGAFYKT